MAAHTEASAWPARLGSVSRWWAELRRHGAALSELARCSPAELERLARNGGASKVDLPVLAGKWPDSANQLARRVAAGSSRELKTAPRPRMKR